MRTLLVVGLLAVVVGGVQPVRADDEPVLELPLPLALRDRDGHSYVERPKSWLSSHQCPDGHWDAANWDRWIEGLPVERKLRLPGRGSTRENVTATSMALCAILGQGYTHRGRHRFAEAVRGGFRWLAAQQASNGRIGPDVRAHAWATLALTELYGMTGSRLWRDATKRALHHLMETQEDDGGWLREEGRGQADLLGTFLAVLPLKSLELLHEDRSSRGEPAPLGLDPGPALARMGPWLDARTDARTGRVKTDGARVGEHGLLLTAAGMLTRILLGTDPRTDSLIRKAAKLLAQHPPTPSEPAGTSDLAYIWFGTLAMFKVGGEPWKIWNENLKTALVDTQHKAGPYGDVKGSWDANGPWVRSVGRVGSTALGSLCLSVYYRYDKVFGDEDGPGGVAIAPVAPGTWQRSVLPSHAAQFEDRDRTALPIESARLAAEVHGVRARVVVDLWVRNPSGRVREGRLRIRLPDGAAPYYLAFGESTWERAAPFDASAAVRTDLRGLRAQRKGDWGAMREARMAPTEPARHGYETIVHERRDPALLSWVGGGVFQLGVFPLRPRNLHRVVLAYEVDLTPVGDEYQLDLHLPDDVPQVSAAVTVRGVPWRTLPDAPLADCLRQWANPVDRALRVLVRPEGDVMLVDESVGGGRHVALWIRPRHKREEAASLRARAIFLLDTSASGRAAHFAVQVDLLEALLERNRDVLKQFRLAVFDSEVRWWREGFVENTSENVAALLAFVKRLELGGATDLDRALYATAQVEEDCDVFLLSDGRPTWGATDYRDLVPLPPGKRVFAYRAGLEGESGEHLDFLARTTGGAVISVLGPGDVASASTAHRHAVWRIADARIGEGFEVLAPGRPRTLYAGQRLCLVGRGGRLPRDADLQLDLRHGADQRILKIPLPTPIPSTMAKRAFGHAAVVELEALGEGKRDRAQAFASHYRVVRESTSLLMMESEKDYARFGIHRPRVDPDETRGPLELDGVPSIGEPPAPKGEERSLRFDGLFGVVAVVSPADFEVPTPLLTALRTRPIELEPLRVQVEEHAARSPSREVGTCLEEESGRLDALLGVAYDAWDAGRRGQTYVGLCAGLPRHPRSRVLQWQLARAAEALGLHDQALVWFELALAWRGRGDFVEVVAHDYARFLRHVVSGRRGIALKRFALARAKSLQGLDLIEAADLVVLLSGSEPRGDLDLLVVDAEGARHDPADFDDPIAPFHVKAVLRGAGPTMVVASKGATEGLALEIGREPVREEAQARPELAQVVVVRDWGRPTERTMLRTITLTDEPIRIPLDDS